MYVLKNKSLPKSRGKLIPKGESLYCNYDFHMRLCMHSYACM